jgi:hypothetical protein
MHLGSTHAEIALKNKTLYNKEGGDVERCKEKREKTYGETTSIHFTKEFVK